MSRVIGSKRAVMARVVGGQVAALVVIAGLGVWLQAQGATPAPDQTFKTGVDLVYVDVSVLDRERRPIRGLSAADFTVREDGTRRSIVAFESVDIAPAAGARVAAASGVTYRASDVATNAFGDSGRLVVIALDTTAPRTERGFEVRAREAAMRIVDNLQPSDMAAVALVGLGTPQGFTADRTLLRAAIDQPFQGFADDDGMRTGACACSCVLEALTDVATALATVPQRRKVLFHVGSYLTLQQTSLMQPPCLREVRERLFIAAKSANLTIHTLDPLGLETLATRADVGLTPGRDRTGVAAKNLLERQGNLRVLPGLTGGRAVVNTNDPGEHVSDMLAESEVYYVLAFERGTPDDAQFHEIDVQVNRRGAIVQARQGYFGPRAVRQLARRVPPSISAPLADALAGAWPVDDMPLAVAATAVASADAGVATVLLTIAPRVSDGAGTDAEATGTFDVLAGAFNRFGHSIDYHVQSVEAPVSVSDGRTPFELLSNLTVPTGRHEIRVAVHDRHTDRRGSVYTYIDVPDFSRLPLSVSTVALESSAAPPLASSGTARSVLPLRPTTVRSFTSEQTLSAFVRVYQGSRGEMGTVIVAGRVTDADGKVVRELSKRVAADEFDSDRRHDVIWPVALEGMPGGDYVLTFEVTKDGDMSRSEVAFAVTPD